MGVDNKFLDKKLELKASNCRKRSTTKQNNPSGQNQPVPIAKLTQANKHKPNNRNEL
jgi:hypothetical protein